MPHLKTAGLFIEIVFRSMFGSTNYPIQVYLQFYECRIGFFHDDIVAVLSPEISKLVIMVMIGQCKSGLFNVFTDKIQFGGQRPEFFQGPVLRRQPGPGENLYGS
jgi:hypothetical protein